MRSTRFVLLSILLHAMCAMALVMAPERLAAPETINQNIEVKMGDAADKSGDAQAADSDEASKAAPVEQAEQAKPEPVKTEPVQPVQAVKPPEPIKKVAVKTTPIKRSVPTKAKVAAVAPVSDDADAPTVNPDSSTEPSDDVAQTESEVEKQEAQEEKPVLTPVKESAPAGVEAAAVDVPEDKPEPKASVEEAPKAAAAAPADAGDKKGDAKAEQQAGELHKGGATEAAAISYLDLKQMNGNKLPEYPMQARLERRQGTLELVYRVTKDGKVTDIQLVKSSGSKDLDESAIKAIANYRYVPGQEGWARHPVQFNLKGDIAILPSRLRLKGGKQAQAD